MGSLDLGIVLWPEGSHHEEGGAALGVPGIVQGRLARELQNIVNHGRQVDGSNLVPAESPEVGILECQPGVVPGVNVSPGIAQPDVIPGISIVVRQGVLRPIEQEAIRAAE